MTSLLSGSDVAQIKQLRKDGWDTARAVADPSVDLILIRGGVELVAQPVAVSYPKRATTRFGGAPPMTETQADIVFRRSIDDGFDVAIRDRFKTPDETGVITRISRNGGMVRAEGRLEGAAT